MIELRIVHGREVLDSHWNLRPGKLSVFQRDDGRWFAKKPHGSVHIIAQEVVEPDWDPEDSPSIGIVDENEVIFIPDPGECQRIGIPVDYVKWPKEVAIAMNNVQESLDMLKHVMRRWLGTRRSSK